MFKVEFSTGATHSPSVFFMTGFPMGPATANYNLSGFRIELATVNSNLQLVSSLGEVDTK